MSKQLSDVIKEKLSVECTVNEYARLLHNSVLTFQSHKSLRAFPVKGFGMPGFVEGNFWEVIKEVVVEIQNELHLGQYYNGYVEYAGTEVTVEKSSVALCYSYVVKTSAEDEGDFLYYLGIPEGYLLKYDAHVVFTATGAILTLNLASSISSQDAWDKEMENRSVEFIMDL